MPALASAQVLQAQSLPDAASPVPVAIAESAVDSATLPPVTVEASPRRTPKPRRPHKRNSRNPAIFEDAGDRKPVGPAGHLAIGHAECRIGTRWTPEHGEPNDVHG